MDNMNTMDFNQKIDVSLRASLEATPVERNASDDLSTGSSSDGFWDLIVLYTGSPQTLQNEFPSSSFTFLLGNYAIVKISEDDIPSLAAFPQVIYIERPRQLFFEIVSARQSSCLSAIQENSSYGLTGKGILISVIDSGIDYAHPDFCNPDKTTRLVALWDQTILADPSAGRFAPAGYSQGTLFSPEQINAALQADTFEQRMELVPSTDVTGHGTHVAGIAAGNGRASGGLYRGVAPESSLLAVKLGSPDPKGFPNTIELMQAVDFSVRYAIEPKYGKYLKQIQAALSELDGNAAMKELKENGCLKLDSVSSEVVLLEEDLLITMTQAEGFVTEGDNNVTVVMDTRLTPELIEEGFVRELISKIQTMRKEAGFEVMDHIAVSYTADEKVTGIFNKYGEKIQTEVLANAITAGTLAGYQKEWSINGEKVTLAVEKQ